MKAKLLIISSLTAIIMTGCSYVTDSIEGAITNRASFSADAVYSGGSVTITWDEADFDSDFAGIEIYRTSEPNDEYSNYMLVASQYQIWNGSGYTSTSTPELGYYYTTSYTDTSSLSSGIYFYRVGIIYWDDPSDERTPENGYTGITATDYNGKTHIEKISGYAQVVIP